MITRPQIVTKNRKVLWPVTWQSAYKKPDFRSSNQFDFLWIEDSFSGLPCLELVILWSKTGSAHSARCRGLSRRTGTVDESSIPPMALRPELEVRVGGARSPVTINGLSRGDAVTPQRKFGKSKLAACCPTDMVKRPMPCSVLQCSSWKQEVAKAKCRLAWSLEDRSKPSWVEFIWW